MTIEYLSGNRLRGLSSDRESNSTLTFSDDFTSDNATDTHSANIGVTGGKWEFDFKRDGTNDSSALDLGSALSNTTWTIDFDFYLNAVTLGNIWGGFAISNQDETSSRESNSKHCIFMSIGGGTGGTDDNISLETTYNAGTSNASSGGTQEFSTATVSADLTTHYCRMRRTSSTTADLTFYTTAARTTISETLTMTDVNALSVGYRYITIHNMDADSGGSGTLTGYIDNIKVYDTVTAPITYPINDVVDGSIFYATDTNKSYILYSGSWSEL